MPSKPGVAQLKECDIIRPRDFWLARGAILVIVILQLGIVPEA
jgi:hypothetical protein